ncbi:hypothetical protein KC357_g4219 [Hortaea werneckii]|nr:hypothetical protein KC357_g4219 [Hortaea werneckii]
MEMLKYRVKCCLIALNRTVFWGLVVVCIPFTLGMSLMWVTALDHNPKLTYPQNLCRDREVVVRKRKGDFHRRQENGRVCWGYSETHVYQPTWTALALRKSLS